MMNNTEFHKIILPLDQDLFSELSRSIQFEVTGKGRLGNHLVHEGEEGIPLVRTTTNYSIPAHTFSDQHKMIVDSIHANFNDVKQSAIPLFNNALIEIYDRHYTKMKTIRISVLTWLKTHILPCSPAMKNRRNLPSNL